MKYSDILRTLLIVPFCNLAYGISIQSRKDNISNDAIRDSIEPKNEVLLNDQSSKRARTEKRGIWEIEQTNLNYGEDPSGPQRPFYFSSPGYYGNDHHHGDSGGGYNFPPKDILRPTNYGSNYGPTYEGGYEGEYHHQDYGGGNKGYGIGGFKSLALKKILLPLAGLAILGVAAVASHNPVLLQLGVVNGRRKRSAVPSNIYPLNPRVKPRRKH